jgi:hypothetical protein
MSESQENIEAKLIAYVEGDLDLAGRTEIEQHLKSNPTHRKLLEELKQTRDFVRGLPRSKAPPELVETLQGHLERSALLDNIGTEGGPLQMRSSRMPQLLSIAAVVLLAVGLGTVVFIALPRGDDRSTVARGDADGLPATVPVALSTRPATPSVSTITIVPPEATLTDARGAADGEVAGATTQPAAGPAAPLAVATADAPTTAPAATPTAVALGEQVGGEPAREAIASAEFGGRERGPAVANAPATAEAGDMLAATPTETPGAARSDVPLILTADALPKNDALYVVVNAADPLVANERVASYLSGNSIAYENVMPPAALATIAQAARDEDGKLKVGTQQDGEEFERSANAAKESTQAQAQNNYGGGEYQQQQQFAMSPEQQKQLRSPQGRVAQQFLAKRMTRQQVAELQSALSEQDVQLVEPPSPDPDALRPGDEVEITVNELVGPGVEKTNRARVNDEGNISMPMIEPMRAAGLTPAALSDAVGRRYRDASLIDQPTVTVGRVADGPATIPATTAFDATTQPTTRVLSEQGQTTAGPAGDAGMDVVIVVQTADLVAPALPATLSTTTQPATAPATRPVDEVALPTTTPTAATTRPDASPLPATLPQTLPMP